MPAPLRFRAWDKKDKRWNYEVSLCQNGELEIAGTGGAVGVNKDDYEISFSSGLFDRDGVEIFDGDIVRYQTLALGVWTGIPDTQIDKISEVYWSEEGSWILPGHYDGSFDSKNYTVIGNIHSHPHLLSNKE